MIWNYIIPVVSNSLAIDMILPLSLMVDWMYLHLFIKKLPTSLKNKIKISY